MIYTQVKGGSEYSDEYSGGDYQTEDYSGEVYDSSTISSYEYGDSNENLTENPKKDTTNKGFQL